MNVCWHVCPDYRAEVILSTDNQWRACYRIYNAPVLVGSTDKCGSWLLESKVWSADGRAYAGVFDYRCGSFIQAFMELCGSVIIAKIEPLKRGVELQEQFTLVKADEMIFRDEPDYLKHAPLVMGMPFTAKTLWTGYDRNLPCGAMSTVNMDEDDEDEAVSENGTTIVKLYPDRNDMRWYVEVSSHGTTDYCEYCFEQTVCFGSEQDARGTTAAFLAAEDARFEREARGL